MIEFNVFAVIILAAIVIEFILDETADYFNLKHLSLEIPSSARDIYKPDEYLKSQQYTRVKTRFGLITSIFHMLVLLIFWFAGGFNFLDHLIRAWGFHAIINGLIYTGILLFAYQFLSLPFTIYGTFVIEKRFGFNRTTYRLFIKDLLKGLVLSVLLGVPLLSAVLAIFLYAGNLAWLYVWLAVTVFSLFMSFVFPVWIMPLFNKFTPLPDGELKDTIIKYTNSVGYKISKIFVMDASKRSTKSNAFFTGFGHNKRIVLFDTLVEKHTVPELVGVLAHEVGHYKKKHILIGMLVGIVHTGIIFFLISIFLTTNGIYLAFGVEHQSVYTGLLFFGFLYAPVELLLSIIFNAVSRRNENSADLFAVQTTHQPQGLIDALKKLTATNLSNLRPHPLYVFLHYSHPPVLERIASIQRYQTGQEISESLTSE